MGKIPTEIDIKNKRIDLGMSIEEAAEWIGCNKKTLIKLEQGKDVNSGLVRDICHNFWGEGKEFTIPDPDEIKETRWVKRIQITELSKLSGVNRKQIERYEEGNQIMFSRLRKIIKILEEK